MISSNILSKAYLFMCIDVTRDGLWYLRYFRVFSWHFPDKEFISKRDFEHESMHCYDNNHSFTQKDSQAWRRKGEVFMEWLNIFAIVY